MLLGMSRCVHNIASHRSFEAFENRTPMRDATHITLPIPVVDLLALHETLQRFAAATPNCRAGLEIRPLLAESENRR